MKHSAVFTKSRIYQKKPQSNRNTTKYKPFPIDLLNTQALSTEEIVCISYIVSKVDHHGIAAINVLEVDDQYKQPWYKRTETRKHIKGFINKGILNPIIKPKHNKILGYSINVDHSIFTSKSVMHMPVELIGNDPKTNHCAIIRHLGSARCHQSRLKKKNKEDRPYQAALADRYKIDVRTIRKRDKVLFNSNKLKREGFSKYKNGGYTYDIPMNMLNKTYSKKPFGCYFSYTTKSLDGFCTSSYRLNKYKLNLPSGRVDLINKAQQASLWRKLKQTTKLDTTLLDKIRNDCDRRNLVFFNSKALNTYVLKASPRFKPSKIYLRNLVDDTNFLKEVACAKDNLDPFNPGYIQNQLRKLKFYNKKFFHSYDDAVAWGKEIFKKDYRQPSMTYGDEFTLESESNNTLNTEGLIESGWVSDPSFIDDVIANLWKDEVSRCEAIKIVKRDIAELKRTVPMYKYLTKEAAITWLVKKIKPYPGHQSNTIQEVPLQTTKMIRDLLPYKTVSTNNQTFKCKDPLPLNQKEPEYSTAQPIHDQSLVMEESALQGDIWFGVRETRTYAAAKQVTEKKDGKLYSTGMPVMDENDLSFSKYDLGSLMSSLKIH